MGHHASGQVKPYWTSRLTYDREVRKGDVIGENIMNAISKHQNFHSGLLAVSCTSPRVKPCTPLLRCSASCRVYRDGVNLLAKRKEDQRGNNHSNLSMVIVLYHQVIVLLSMHAEPH